MVNVQAFLRLPNCLMRYSMSQLPFRKPVVSTLKLRRLCFGFLTALMLHANAWAQTVVPLVAPSGPSAKPVAAASPKIAASTATQSVSKSSWSDLTPAQKQALTPLAASWISISEPQKRKWLEISRNYRTLTPDGQVTMHSRMNEWVALSPQQRAQARLNFAKTQELSTQLTPEEKKAKWEAYQDLSGEEKQKLAAKGSPKPAGAATAVKPVAPQKLAVTPLNQSKSVPKAAPVPVASAPAPPLATELTPGAITAAPPR